MMMTSSATRPSRHRDPRRGRMYEMPTPRSWSTTTCWCCAAPSAPSPRWPTSGPRRRSPPCSTTRPATAAASPAATCRPRALQRLGVEPAQLPAPAAAAARRRRARLPVGGHDVIVSSSSAFAHGVRKRRGARARLLLPLALPLRLARARPRPGRGPAARCGPRWPPLLRRHRAFDRRAARPGRPLHRQLAAHARADPPLLGPRLRRSSTRRSTSSASRSAEPGEHFLFVGELVAHKRADVAIEAAVAAGRPIRVVGEGPERERLEARYGGRGAVPRARARRRARARLRDGRALVVPNVEEFGIAAVEAQAAGRPVVAVDAGGVRETVVDGRTGRARAARRPRRPRPRAARATSAASTGPRSAGTPSASRARRSRSGWPTPSTA